MATAESMIAVTTPHGRKALTVVRWGLVLFYAWSAGGKFFWPGHFRELLLGTGMLPDAAITPLTYALPAFELLLALALAARLVLPLVLILSTLLSTVFTAVHGYLIISGTLVPCGCVGVSIDFSTREWHILLLLLSTAMAVGSVVLLFTTPRARPPRASLALEESARGRGAPNSTPNPAAAIQTQEGTTRR